MWDIKHTYSLFLHVCYKLQTVPFHAEMVERVPWVNACVLMALKETTAKIQVTIIMYLSL